MITYNEIPESKIVEFTVDGKINAEDYHKLAENFLAFVEKHDKVRVLKQIKSFEGFDLEILREKLLGELLRHQGNITHAALVS
ncbi:MAG: STAS/SEC14 domain-containing protein, partial [Cyanobacteria bacterium HKST-UBA01]|nr:STAS/SEC14 domain-containing protein [Cyanobacteria bacterium HKST-UBA01]